MNGAQLKAARQVLGLSLNQMAGHLGLVDADDNGNGDVVRKWERRTDDVPHSVAIVVAYWIRDMSEARAKITARDVPRLLAAMV